MAWLSWSHITLPYSSAVSPACLPIKHISALVLYCYSILFRDPLHSDLHLIGFSMLFRSEFKSQIFRQVFLSAQPKISTLPFSFTPFCLNSVVYGCWLIFCLFGEKRSSPKQIQFCIMGPWVLVKVILVLGNKCWLWLKKKKHKQISQKDAG